METNIFFDAVVPLGAAWFGAWFGAATSAKLTTRKERRHELVRAISEIQTVKLELEIACKDLVSFKKQLLKPWIEDYRKERKRVLNELGTPTKEKLVEVHLDLRAFQNNVPDLAELAQKVAMSYRIPSRILLLAKAASESVKILNTLNSRRSEWIELARDQGLEGEKLVHPYFGIGVEGNNDSRFKDTMDNMWQSCEDAIFFTHLATVDLHHYVLKLRASYYRTFGPYFKKQSELPTLSRFLLEEHAKGEIPSSDNYKQWLEPPVELKKPFWQSNISFERKSQLNE